MFVRKKGIAGSNVCVFLLKEKYICYNNRYEDDVYDYRRYLNDAQDSINYIKRR